MRGLFRQQFFSLRSSRWAFAYWDASASVHLCDTSHKLRSRHNRSSRETPRTTDFAFLLTKIESLRQLSDTPLDSLSPAASCASGMVEILQVNRITESDESEWARARTLSSTPFIQDHIKWSSPLCKIIRRNTQGRVKIASGLLNSSAFLQSRYTYRASDYGVEEQFPGDGLTADRRSRGDELLISPFTIYAGDRSLARFIRCETRERAFYRARTRRDE